MENIGLDLKNIGHFIEENEFFEIQKEIGDAHKILHTGKNEMKDFGGWLDLPIQKDANLIDEIRAEAEEIKNNSDIFLVIGIGGSYLGSRAGIEALTHNFHNLLDSKERKSPRILFLGNNLSATYMNDLLDVIKDQKITVNVISKSGTTLETAIAFRIIKKFMHGKYGEQARKRIIVTTDKNKGALRELVDKKGYKSFEIPDNIGGRYSILTTVGLLPMAVAGINICKVLDGAMVAHDEYIEGNLEKNNCYMYAGIRNILYRKGRTIEIMAGYEPSLHYLIEWWKQLYGESEGKCGKGIFPVGANFTTDLHSLGQYIQDGMRNIFETTINIEKARKTFIVPELLGNCDGLDYIMGKDLSYVNKKAMEGTVASHFEGDVPNLTINIPEMNEEYFGQMIYFFEKACGISGYLLGVNPFDQPGVESYKKNMFRLLGKPGCL